MARFTPQFTDEQTGEREFQKGCAGKIRYPAKNQAKSAIRRMIAEGVTTHGARFLTTYRCRYCGKHHVGHNRRIDLKENP